MGTGTWAALWVTQRLFCFLYDVAFSGTVRTVDTQFETIHFLILHERVNLLEPGVQCASKGFFP